MEVSTSTISLYSSPPQADTPSPDMDAFSLDRLSTHLERLLVLDDPAFPNRADTEIVLASGGSDGEPGAAANVGAHSCILAARSPFFLQYFSSIPTTAAAGEKARLNLADMVPGGRHIGRDALVAVLAYLYTGRLKVPPQECLDDTCRHGACRPAIDFLVEFTYAASAFQIPELVSIVQRRLSGIVDIAFDEDIIPIIRVASSYQLSHLLEQCIRRVGFSTLDDNFLEKELAGDIYNDIKTCRRCLNIDELDDAYIVDAERDKRITDIHKALDCGNVDLVSMLLKQYGVTLDDAFAIHYAATYCEPKVLRELLKLDHANVNKKNSGGYTPLHMACMRLEPDIVVALLNKGASVLEQTQDRRDALTICKRLTRHQKDVNRELRKGQETSKHYLCILPILEEIKRTSTNQVCIEEAIARFTPLRVDNFFKRLLELECRVRFAKLFFPSVAQLAMRIAEADSTEEFAEAKLKDIDLNESLHRRFRERFDALTRTVELGRRYFPSCSDVLDKLLTEESAVALLGNSTPEEDQVTKHLYELKKEVQKAFDKDIVSECISSTGLVTELQLLYKRGMLNLGTNPSQAEGAADSTNAHAHAPPSGLSIQASSGSTASRQESQRTDVAVDDDVGVGSKRKLKSPVWDEFKKVKTGDDWFAICRRCQQQLKACSKNGTNHLHRHVKKCQSTQATKGLSQSTLKLSQNPMDSTINLEKNVFDQNCARKELALMISIHEYPLSIVEHAGFRKFCAAMQPMFKVVSKNTIMKDILDMYEAQKILMVKHFQQFEARVAVTVDTWTVDHSNKSYMAITTHYIDDTWRLKSYLLRFIYVPTPYTGELLSDVLHEVLMEWQIETKLSTMSLDNCTISDNVMDKMLNKLTLGCLMLDGSFLHMRHAAHKLNLIMKDGMAVMDKGIERVRQSVAFWVATPERHQKFEKEASQRNMKYDNRIALDCKTSWNSTYVMLSTALDYQEVFVCLAQSEKLFTPCCPTSADWKFVRELCDRFKIFFDITKVLSDTTYVSANLFFPKLCSIYLDIRKWQPSDPLTESMLQLLKQKFEKYWSDVCVPMAVATVLDPRYKLHLLTAVFIEIYGKEGANEKVAKVSKLLYNLVSHYNSMDGDATACGYPTSAVQNQGNNELFELFDEYMSRQPVTSSFAHTELDVYLNESTLPRTQELDIIHWWQFEGTKYPTLRKIARDIMASSMTTIPSKSVFSTGGRTISPHRSRLAPNMVEALMCVQDWSCTDMLGPDFATISSLTTCLDEEKEMDDTDLHGE